MAGFGDYDAWKLHGPDDDAETCAECGGWLRYYWKFGWCCEACESEREIYELIAAENPDDEVDP
jgi:hypothetical protein